MRVYYSHAMPLYGTQKEKLEKILITNYFPGCDIVDPGTYQSNVEKARRGMDYCLELVDQCESVVFSRYENFITAGVGKEVNHALSKAKLVYELKKGVLSQVGEPVEYLDRDETRMLYIERQLQKRYSSRSS